jgi:hypothetical protein
MSYEQKDNQGSLFKNERKAEPAHADYNGSIRVEGKDYWLNCWVNESKNGKKYMSLSVKRKDGTAARPEPSGKVAPLMDDSEIPF